MHIGHAHVLEPAARSVSLLRNCAAFCFLARLPLGARRTLVAPFPTTSLPYNRNPLPNSPKPTCPLPPTSFMPSLISCTSPFSLLFFVVPSPAHAHLQFCPITPFVNRLTPLPNSLEGSHHRPFLLAHSNILPLDIRLSLPQPLQKTGTCGLCFATSLIRPSHLAPQLPQITLPSSKPSFLCPSPPLSLLPPLALRRSLVHTR